MKIQWYRSATVGIFSNSGTSILCDPWITDGAFIGSWYHWPPLQGFEFDFLVKQKWDAIYISHFHADHFDRKLLSAIIRKQIDLKVLIPEYSNKWLRRAVLNCGLDDRQIIEVPSHKSIMYKDFKISMFVADFCNSEICGSSISCGSTPRRQTSNDSVALFEADGQRVLNANDALAVHTAHRLWPLIDKVDLLLGHFGGAGPYPQCFSDIEDNLKLQKAEALAWTFVDRLISTADRLNAKYTLPYAGQYVLGGSLHSLNKFRSVIPLPDVLAKIESANVTNAISLMPFEEFDISKGEIGLTWQEPTNEIYEGYIKKIGTELYPYQKIEKDWNTGQVVLERALESVKNEFLQFLSHGGVGSNSSITVAADDVTSTINFGASSCSLTQKPVYENITKLQMDKRLLRRLLVRRPNYRGFTQFHFNQAEIGSHMSWQRVGPYPAETNFLNFMQDSSVTSLD